MVPSPQTIRWRYTTAGDAPIKTCTCATTPCAHELRYQNGFDCQGLWVEVEVEKELGFQFKKDIEDYGLDRFVRKCKERVLRYAAVQTEQSTRLGYWMDWNDPDQLRTLARLLSQNPGQLITVPGPDGPGQRYGGADRRPAGHA